MEAKCIHGIELVDLTKNKNINSVIYALLMIGLNVLRTMM